MVSRKNYQNSFRQDHPEATQFNTRPLVLFAFSLQFSRANDFHENNHLLHAITESSQTLVNPSTRQMFVKSGRFMECAMIVNRKLTCDSSQINRYRYGFSSANRIASFHIN